MTPTDLPLGEYIRQKVFPAGLSVTEAASTLGIGRPALSNMLNGKAALSPEMASKIERAFKVKASDLLAIQASQNALSVKSNTTVLATTKSYVPPFLQLKANQIEEWANGNLSTRNRLAVFLRTLVNSTGNQLSKVDFPGNDDSERPGWDGQVESNQPSPWIPHGKSGWEFGVNKNPKTKADGDYQKSVAQATPQELSETTFIFVTPRRWPGKAAWIAEKKAKKQWLDVRAYDSSDLEQWLEQSIPAQTWLAKELHLPTEDVYSIASCWNTWADAANPPLSEALFAEPVSLHSSQLVEKLNATPPETVVVTADSIEEALAFLHSALSIDDNGAKLKDRLVVFKKPGVLPRLISKSTNFIPIITNREVEKEFAPYKESVSAIIIYPRNDTNAKAHIQLEQLSSTGFSNALKAMGFKDSDIERYKRESGQSLTVLRRRLATLEAVQLPEWASTTDIVDLFIPFLMAGAWNTNNKADQNILAKLAGKPFEELEKDFLKLLRLHDSPVWSAGTYQGIASKIDALFAANLHISKTHLQRFFEIAEEVLSEDDPSLDMPEADRWTAGMYGKKREISRPLRDSISETLVLLSLYGPDLFQKKLGFDPALAVEHLIEKLLSPLTARKLEAHSSDLPMYAEASPERFLELLEADLDSPESETMKLMRPADSGIFGSCPRTGILWALENTAWVPGLLRRTCDILAHLAEPVINDNWSHKPSLTLGYIFLWWMPQTSAPLEERIRVMDYLAKRYPQIIWPILVQQFNGHSRVGHYSHKPHWRSDGRGFGEPVTEGEGYKFLEYAIDKALAWEKHTKETLGDLVSSFIAIKNEFPAKAPQIWALIEEWNKTATDEDRASLREKVRIQTRTRRARKWAGDNTKERDTARKIYDLLEPKDFILQNEWLFKAGWIEETEDELEDEDLDYTKRDKRIEELRTNVLRRIWSQNGIEGVWSLTVRGDAARTIGWIMSKIVIDTEMRIDLVKSAIAIDDSLHPYHKEQLLYGMLASVEGEDLKQLIITIGKTLSTPKIINLLTTAPCSQPTLDALASFSPEIQSQYWKQVNPQRYGLHDEELSTIVKNLIEAKRPRAAFWTTQFSLKQLQPQELYRLMIAIATDSQEQEGTYQLDSYRVVEAITALQESGEIPQDDMAVLEFKYLGVLSHDGKIPNLESQVLSNPDLFVQAIAFLYKRQDGGKDPEALQPNDPELVHGLATGAYKLLDKLTKLPGMQPNGTFSSEAFKNWITHVRNACKELSRSDVADVEIGKLFANAPKGKDGVWALEETRDCIEWALNEHAARGARTEFYNLRGVHWRGEGGDQERELVAHYTGWAEALEFTHPRMAKVMRHLADGYQREATEQDTRADVNKRLGRF